MMTRTRDERGATAVIFAISALLIFGIAALGVDLGNSMNRKRQTQTSADLAALAGANGLPTQDDTTRQMVADYLNQNQPQTDGNERCDTSAGPVTVAELKDGDLSNGEVVFPTAQQITVYSPSTKVNFGLANAIGFDSDCVQSKATARIASGLYGMAPFYATAGCSTGLQTLKDNSGGLSIPFSVPPLSHDTETFASTVTSINPTQISLGSLGQPDGPTITLTGTGLAAASVNQVGFFNPDQTEPIVATPLTQTATQITVNVPNAVASSQDVWWIRVHSPTVSVQYPNGPWSARATAQGLQVGDARLSCDAGGGGPASGNFGQIDLPWGGNDGNDLAKNLKLGLRPPMSLKPWTGTLPPDYTCDTAPGSVTSTDALSKADTNCVQSVTGLEANDAYEGYLGTGGRLLSDTSAACTALGRPQRSVTLNANDDLLSCFLKNTTLRISDTVLYTGTDSLYTQDIWKSPRLVMVPLLQHDPVGTKWMPIVKIVPGFITDQSTGATKNNPIVGTDTDNGLIVQNPKKLRALRVIFFSMNALPPPPDGVALQNYIGSGKKIVTLVN